MSMRKASMLKASSMKPRGEEGGGGGGGYTPGSSGTTTATTTQYKNYASTKKMGVWKGVSAWTDNQNDLHLGSGQSETEPAFFTYDPTEDGIETFSFPFYQKSGEEKPRGCLSQWWAGSEAICDTLSNFLKTNACVGYPYYEGFGFVFRKNVPRLIFVFSNEFDNPVVKDYSNVSGAVSNQQFLLPGADDDDVTFRSFFSDSSSNQIIDEQDALDPLCLRTLLDENQDEHPIKDYLQSLIISPGDGNQITPLLLYGKV